MNLHRIKANPVTVVNIYRNASSTHRLINGFMPCDRYSVACPDRYASGIHSDKEVTMKTKAIFLATILATIGVSTAALAAPESGDASTGSKVVQYSSDAAITTKVKTALLAEKNLKSLDVHVVTHNGIVQLSGVVVSCAQLV